MYIKINENEYELKTTLGVAKALETRAKTTITNIMAELNKTATVADMITTLSTALSDKTAVNRFEVDILDNMDFLTVQKACEELLLNICFGGTPEEQEKKIEDFPASAVRKNLMRKALKLPIPKTDSISEKSLEQAIE